MSSHSRSSRARYRAFVQDYKARRLDEVADAEQHGGKKKEGADATPPKAKGKRREYVRDYLRWLKPHRAAIAWGVGMLVSLGPALYVLHRHFGIGRPRIDEAARRPQPRRHPHRVAREQRLTG